MEAGAEGPYTGGEAPYVRLSWVMPRHYPRRAISQRNGAIWGRYLPPMLKSVGVNLHFCVITRSGGSFDCPWKSDKWHNFLRISFLMNHIGFIIIARLKYDNSPTLLPHSGPTELKYCFSWANKLDNKVAWLLGCNPPDKQWHLPDKQWHPNPINLPNHHTT